MVPFFFEKILDFITLKSQAKNFETISTKLTVCNVVPVEAVGADFFVFCSSEAVRRLLKPRGSAKKK